MSCAQIIEGPVPFFALCEQHALPFYGMAYVGYIAHESIIGISKLARLVRLFSKRFAVPERIGPQIADTLETMLHLCVEMRRVRETAPMTRTTVWHGHYAEDSTLPSEFFTACGLQRNER